MQFSFIHQKDMYESDYAQQYPEIQLRNCVQNLDTAYLKSIAYISGDLPAVITVESIEKMVCILEDLNKKIPDYEKPIVHFYASNSVDLFDNTNSLFLDVHIFYRHFGLRLSKKIQVVIENLNQDKFSFYYYF